MNELLTNLYRSCRSKEALKSQDIYESANVLIGSEVEKFAELIVMECLTICEELGDKGMDGHYCADRITKTFRS